MSANFDVFLSYQWDIKTKIESLYKLLTDVYNLKVWMDDHELDHTGNLYDQLVTGLKSSKYFLCFITQKYTQSKNCKFEIEFASNLNSKMIVIMIEDLQMKDIGSVGLIINVKTRINMFHQAKLGNIWSGEAYDSLLKSIQISKSAKDSPDYITPRNLLIRPGYKKKTCLAIISLILTLICVIIFSILTFNYQGPVSCGCSWTKQKDSCCENDSTPCWIKCCGDIGCAAGCCSYIPK